MVVGLETFKAHFKDHMDKFIMIGGTACDIVMSEMDRDFRLTKDLDIVLIIEALDAGFSECFWDFIKKGEYDKWENSIGEKKIFRFVEPKDKKNFPFKIELFSRKPDVLSIPDGCIFTPIPIDEECSSLSAILLDEDYYSFILSGKRTSDGLQIVTEEHLIPMKAKAHLDLLQRKNSGVHVNSDDVKKHKRDVFRLFQILTPESSVDLPESIAQDLSQFLDLMTQEPPDIINLGIKTTPLEEVISRLRKTYNLS